MNARDELYNYADDAHLGGDYLDELLDRVEEEAAAKAVAEIRKRAAREVFAEKMTETPKGWSERYVAGWNDAIDAAADKVRDGGQP
ncbi:hypothetical protein [Streptomyces ardesiacus]|uniref:hypothetical protein n=1 Tax=Streptomyces ardesiacus TaxID=285564 RepID=UPI002FDBC174